MKQALPSMISWEKKKKAKKRNSSRFPYFILCTVFLWSCDRCAPRTGIQTLQTEFAQGCIVQEGSTRPLTKNPGSSTQPSITPWNKGYILAWRDDRELPQSLYLQKIDPLGSLEGSPKRIESIVEPHRPKLANSETTLALVYSDLSEDQHKVKFQVFNDELDPLLDHPREIAKISEGHSAGITFRDDHFVVALSGGEKNLRLFKVRVGETQNTDGGAPSDAGPSDDAGTQSDADGPTDTPGVEISIEEQTIALGEHMVEPGHIDLMFHGQKLFMVSDSPEGWSIQLSEITETSVDRVSQVLDSRRYPDDRYCCPSIGPVDDEKVALLWQGPGTGITRLFFIVISDEGRPVGEVRSYEALVRNEQDAVIGRAPSFDPDLAPNQFGLVSVCSDNRFANSEIILSSFSCGENQ